jgi:hypothetical protein
MYAGGWLLAVQVKLLVWLWLSMVEASRRRRALEMR